MTGDLRSSGSYFDVGQYGARGDASTLCTSPIQQAIDDCHAAGGGTVVLPPGTYVSGTLYLRSHVVLHLCSGATLLGSPNREDYNADDVFPENVVFTKENTTGAHLIIAYQAEQVAITGQGTIDGNSMAFFEKLPPEEVTPFYWYKRRDFPIREWRPGQMVFFCRCREVAVREVALRNAAYWTLFLLGCSKVQIRGLRISNPPQTQNGDGIDLDCCQDVTVSDCLIESGDDCLTLRGNARALGAAAQPCQNVVVSNCVLSTTCNAVRVGVGDGEIRDCLLNNLVIRESRIGVNVVARYWDGGEHGVNIENVAFSHVSIDALAPITLRVGDSAKPPAAIHNIRFEHIWARGRENSHLRGNPQVPATALSLSEVRLEMVGGDADPAFGPGGLPPAHVNRPDEMAQCALLGQHLENLYVNNLRVDWRGLTGPRRALVIEESRKTTLTGIQPEDLQA